MSAASPGVPPAPPLDAAAAVGGGRALVASNSILQVHDAASGGPPEKSVRLSAFFGPVVAEFAAHNVQRSPSVAFDRSEGRFLLAAASYDTQMRDPGTPGRLLLAASAEASPLMLWRVASVPAPPCDDPGQYAVADAPAVSHSRHGLFVAFVLKCHDPATRALKASAARIVAVDKARLLRVRAWCS
jgi:hypothetical protein